MKNKTVLFYSSVSSLDLFKTQKFYSVDIDILEKLGYNIILSNSIFDAFKFWRYDIIFSYFYRFSFFPSIIARLLLKKVYFTGGIDDLDEDYATPKRYFIQKYFFRLCYWVSHKCIIVSQSDFKNINKIQKKVKKIVLSEHSISINDYNINHKNKEKFFSTIAWMGSTINVKRKGIDVALRIFSNLSNNVKFKDYKFYIIGKNGEGSNFLKELICQYKLHDSVIITGEVTEEQKISILKSSQYYFQLSQYEGFGLAALEALCAGNIIIHSGKGGLSNPIYQSQILFDINNDFDEEFNLLTRKLSQTNYFFKKSQIDYYSIDRRLKDFTNVLNGF